MTITIQQLETENAALREKVAKWERVFGHLGTADECGNEWIALQDQLAAAQATIVNMRDSVAQMGFDVSAFGITNLDALHEDRARECERLANMLGIPASAETLLREEAAAHRARKEGV